MLQVWLIYLIIYITKPVIYVNPRYIYLLPVQYSVYLCGSIHKYKAILSERSVTSSILALQW